MTRIVVLGPDDGAILEDVLPGVFDGVVRTDLVREFLSDARHHLAVATEDSHVVGFGSAVHYVHPDKAPELWINEIGVAPTHRNKGIGKALLRALFGIGRDVGCREAWVLTEQRNHAARCLYESMGGTEPPHDSVMYSFTL